MIIQILNSDYANPSTPGFRAGIVGTELKHKKIYCRDTKTIGTKVIPMGKLLMRGISLYGILTKKDTDNLRTYLFEKLLMKKISEEEIKSAKTIISMDFLPKFYKHAKSINPKIKIVQDVPIALRTILNELPHPEHLLGEKKKTLQPYIKQSFQYIDQFIAPSEFVKKSLVKEKIKSNKIVTIPFGVDSKKFKPQNKPKKFTIAFAGNITSRKGIRYFMEAWNELSIDAEVNLYGKIYPDAEKYVKEGVNKKGFVELQKELPKNSIYVFPTYLEGSSKSVYEALACGLPVITTFNSGSIITDGKEGYIIPVQDSKGIKEKILKLYDDKKLLERMSKNARKTAEKYTWDLYAKRVRKLL
jgi:glycosyltransferase involved in cell wall biosynthesis